MRPIWLCLILALTLAACNGSSNDKTVVRAASQQGTSGGIADYNGDGVSDLFVGAPYAEGSSVLGAVFVYEGDSSGFAAEPTWTITGDDNFGYRFANVGDIDGDGTEDFAVTAVNGDSEEASLSGSVTVFKGGASGQILKKLGGEQALDKFGYSLTGGCDFNDDGSTDMVVGAISHSPGPDLYLGGAVYVYFGPDLAEADMVKLGATTDFGILGFSSACGDINNDAVDDLVMSAIGTHGVIWHESDVLAYYGTSGFNPETDDPDVNIESSSTQFGESLAVLGDLDDDGFNDIGIGHTYSYNIPTVFPWHTGTVWVVRGGAGSRTVDIDAAGADLVTRVYGESNLERFGSTLAVLDDLDADGVQDFAVGALHGNADGATNLSNGLLTGKVFVFHSSNVAIAGSPTYATAASALSRSERDLHYGSFLAPFEMDGPKLLVGAPTADRHTGAVFVEDLL